MKKKVVLTIINIVAILLLSYPIYIIMKCLISDIEGLVYYMGYEPNYINYEPYYRFIESIFMWSLCVIVFLFIIFALIFSLIYAHRTEINYSIEQLKEKHNQKKEITLKNKIEKLENQLNNIKTKK